MESHSSISPARHTWSSLPAPWRWCPGWVGGRQDVSGSLTGRPPTSPSVPLGAWTSTDHRVRTRTGSRRIFRPSSRGLSSRIPTDLDWPMTVSWLGSRAIVRTEWPPRGHSSERRRSRRPSWAAEAPGTPSKPTTSFQPLIMTSLYQPTSLMTSFPGMTSRERC